MVIKIFYFKLTLSVFQTVENMKKNTTLVRNKIDRNNTADRANVFITKRGHKLFSEMSG